MSQTTRLTPWRLLASPLCWLVEGDYSVDAAMCAQQRPLAPVLLIWSFHNLMAQHAVLPGYVQPCYFAGITMPSAFYVCVMLLVQQCFDLAERRAPCRGLLLCFALLYPMQGEFSA